MSFYLEVTEDVFNLQLRGIADTYRHQLDALTDQMKLWLSSSEQARVHPLLEEFKGFSEAYFKYFTQESVANEYKQETTPHFVFNSVIERLLEEWDIICRTCVQRAVETSAQDLQKADQKLDEYCARIHSAVPLADPITYFEKSYHITRSLYINPYVVIGLRFVSGISQEAALAHELGHHIYWNVVALDQYEEVHQKLQDEVLKAIDQTAESERGQIWLGWLEEIHADACGALLVGPESVSSLSTYLQGQIGDRDDLFLDDAEHPMPFLRPLISATVLGEQAEVPLQKWKDYCKKEWDVDYGRKSGIVQKTFRILSHTLPTSTKKMNEANAQELRDELSQVVDVVLNTPLWPHRQGRDVSLVNLIEPHVVEGANGREMVEPRGNESFEKIKSFFDNDWRKILNLRLSETSRFHAHPCTGHWLTVHKISTQKHYHPNSDTIILCQ
jgi:hypothetical protein